MQGSLKTLLLLQPGFTIVGMTATEKRENGIICLVAVAVLSPVLSGRIKKTKQILITHVDYKWMGLTWLCSLKGPVSINYNIRAVHHQHALS